VQYGVGDQLGGEEFRRVYEGDQTVESEDQPERTATDGDGAGVVGDEQDGFAGMGASMLYAGGPVPRLDTGLRDSPTGTAFIDAEPQLKQLCALLHKVEDASLDPAPSRDFIHRLTKEL